MYRDKKLSGNSLLLVVIISLILSILCASILLIAVHSRSYQIKYDIEQKLARNIQSAKNLVLSDSTNFSSPVYEKIDLFGLGNDSVVIRRGPWGVFQFASVKSTQNKYTKELNFIYGSALADTLNACLYLADHKRPLAISGSTFLVGDVYLPLSGLRYININQNSAETNRLIEGEVKISEEKLPALNKSSLKYLLQLGNYVGDSIFFGKEFGEYRNESIFQSFGQDPILYFHHGKLVLDNINLGGHIYVYSDSLIEVNESAKLSNIILIAPFIKFRSGFRGVVQAISSDSLLAEPGCRFDYPSSLVLLKPKGVRSQNAMILSKNCFLDGTLFAYSENSDLNKSFVEVGQNSLIRGIVYVNGYLSIQGRIIGAALTDYFIYRSPTTVYENYLVNVTLNRRQLSTSFVGWSLINSSHRVIIEWVK